jgi:amidophosphoribosyltransferase
MTEELNHECGVAAVYCLDGAPEAARYLPDILTHLQNRGQLSAGMTTYREGRDQLIDTHKDIGGVREVFRLGHAAEGEALMQRYDGSAAIGHVRYATCGPDDPSYAQPFERHHGRKWKWFSFCFNGNLANYAQLKERLTQKSDYHITRDTDTEILNHYLSYELRGARRPSLQRVFHNLSHTFDGAFNICYLDALGQMAVVRDPLGIRPLCYAYNEKLFVAASESLALSNLGFDSVKSLAPGTMAVVSPGKVRIARYEKSPRKAHCFFEWIYFANAGSVLDDRSVYLARANLGRELAALETEDTTDAVVVPVPDTAKPAADAMAFALGIPSVEGLLRNRYVGRTFIETTDRAAKARQKYSPLREVLEGRKVFLVEDSVVRCTTLHALIDQLRTRGGAKEIHIRVASPPILAPCFYGIDMSSVGELWAREFIKEPRWGPLPRKVRNRLAKEVGADSFFYLPIEAIPRCLDLDEKDLCMACLTAKYPTPHGNRMYQTALDMYRKGVQGRAHEASR